MVLFIAISLPNIAFVFLKCTDSLAPTAVESLCRWKLFFMVRAERPEEAPDGACKKGLKPKSLQRMLGNSSKKSKNLSEILWLQNALLPYICKT